MQQNPAETSKPKSAAKAATTVKADARAVAALQDRVAQMTGSGVLSSAPYSYHH
ncbi:hypothetical protein [Streptomyces sp. NPDC046985]|uniref:hypothetical protein n=1 Tax=Streptomyces sp. NPDC046985 TaxID=3155377 RepID=UPI0033DA05A9